MKTPICLFLLAASLAVTPIHASDLECPESVSPGEIEKVRAQRQVFNQAIADKDIEVIQGVLHEDVILVTGTDSDLFDGRDAQIAIWQDDFGRNDRATYVRTPGCIRVSDMAPVALEFGTWRGVRVDDAESFAAGSYSAKWRKIDNHWLLEGELFSTETCGGSFCP